jgi:multiple sugar transport system substrate-binding protein
MPSNLSRRSFLAGVAAVSVAGLTACATSDTGGGTSSAAAASGASGATDAAGALTVQSNQSDVAAKAGMTALVDAFVASGAGQATLNTVAGEQFRTQLPTYLTSQNPPDVLTWLAGKVAQDYADEGLLLDISDVWATDNFKNYSTALRNLSTGSNGKQIIVPQYYYWLGVYYRKSKFQEWGITPPKTWQEFLQIAQTLDGKGVPAIGIGLQDTPWLASAWFDYMNLRVNGAQFHLDVLAGRQSFADPKVKNAMTRWAEMLPYFDPKAGGLAFQEAQTQLFQGKTGMFLSGSYFVDAAPASVKDDIDFFQFPIIDPAVPVAEEAPADGFLASAKTTRPALTRKFLEFAGSPTAQEAYLQASKSNFLPANSAAKFNDTEANRKGKAMLESAAALTQFFNRDGGDELQPTADSALVKFIQNPGELDSILTEWQAAAQKVRQA